MDDIKILEIEDTSFESKSLIEFTSLIKFLFKLSQRQKYLDNKINLVNERVDEKENRLNNLEIQVFGESKSEDQKVIQSFQSISKISEKKPVDKFEKLDLLSKDYQTLSEKGEKEESEAEGDSIGNLNPDMIRKLFRRVRDTEKKIVELLKKTQEHTQLNNKINNNHDLIDVDIKKIDKVQKELDDLTKKFAEFKIDYEDVKVKVQDFNIYDLFKDGEGVSGGNIDVSKALIMALENKVFKKFSYYDERYKAYDTDIFKIKEDNKNNNNSVEFVKVQSQKQAQDIKDLNQNFEKEISQLREKLEEFGKKMKNIHIHAKEGEGDSKSTINFSDLIDQKLKEFEDQIKNLIKKELDEINNNQQKKESDLKEENETNKMNIKRFNDIEKNIKQIVDEIEPKFFKERFQNLENELLKKFTKIEGLDLKNKINSLEEELKEQSLKLDTNHQAWDKNKSDINNLVKKLEFLNTEYARLSLQKVSVVAEKPEINYDFKNYLEKAEYKENKKEVNSKFEKVRLAIENLGRNLENIVNSLSHTVNEKELVSYQGVVKNTIDELKLFINKRYADKIDTNKSLKYLEAQIKTYLEARKGDGSDNWLLAKKPLNTYLCASCESVIRGELDKRSEYIAWNKYPQREDKTYRMGHGFSRMLQMVNDDIMKSTNTDKIDTNIFLNTNSNNYNQKDDEDVNLTIQASSNSPGNIKLPRVKNKNANTNTNNSQAVNNMEFNLKKEKNKDNKDEKRIITSPYDEPNIDSPNLNRPQIMRIYKLNKNATFSKGNFNTISFNDFNHSGSQEKKPNEDNSKKLYGTNIKNSSTIK